MVAPVAFSKPEQALCRRVETSYATIYINRYDGRIESLEKAIRVFQHLDALTVE